MNLIDLARKLISIRSYVEADANESQLGEFIYGYLQGLDKWKVEKQYVKDGRFNIVAYDEKHPRLMFCGHMDTVRPSGQWAHDPFKGEIEGDNLYGLGACDMKGGIAALLHALQRIEQTQGLFLLFDIDEEYYFAGMKSFLAKYTPKPELAVFMEPGLSIHNGHRGLIEIYLRIRGESGHAAQPEKGRNAIFGAVRAVEILFQELSSYSHVTLGSSTCNLAGLTGGIDREGVISIQPNKIPDIAEIILDIRPASPDLQAEKILEILRKYLEHNGYKVESEEIRLDYGSLFVSPDRLQVLENILKDVTGSVQYADISKYGFGEGKFLNQASGTDCIYLGPGPHGVEHKADEYVSITEMQQAEEIYLRLIQHYCNAPQ